MRSGAFVFPAIERIVYGQPAAQALLAEIERLGANRVFLIVSGTLNRTTDAIARVREMLGGRYAGLYDRMPPHTPPWVWLSTGIRAVDHATEGLCSPVSDPQSDAIYVQALSLLSRALPRVKQALDDLEARLDCQLAIWLSIAGRQGGAQMRASHAIGHVLGGTCGVAHGHTSCVMLPYVLRYNHSANANRQRLVAAAMGHPDKPAADVIAALVADLGQPQRLAEVSVTREHFPVIASHAMEEHYIHTNPRQITRAEQVLEILEAAA